MQGQIIYLDNAASTQCLVPPSEITGNPSSRSHYFGITARKQIEASRSTIAEVLGVTSERLVFTSGASESARIIHHSLGMELVSETAHNCMFFGGIKKIPWKDFVAGNIPAGHSWAELVNNETGIITNTQFGLAGVNVCDATQAILKFNTPLTMESAQFIFGSAHKFHGPLGVGFIISRDVDSWDGLIPLEKKGTQERGVRPGTLNVPAIIQTGEVAKWMLKNGDEYRAKLKHLQSTFENKIKSLTDCWIIGADQERAPHITSLNLPGVDNEALIAAVNDRLAIASGSACTSEKVEPSHVLMAMFNDREIADTTVRISYGWFNTEAEVLEAAEIIAKAAETIRSFSL